MKLLYQYHEVGVEGRECPRFAVPAILQKHNQKGREQEVGLVDSPHHPAPSILRGRVYWKEVVALLARVLSQGGEVLCPPA